MPNPAFAFALTDSRFGPDNIQGAHNDSVAFHFRKCNTARTYDIRPAFGFANVLEAFFQENMTQHLRLLAFSAIALAGLLPVLFYSFFAQPIDSRFHEAFKTALLAVPAFAVLACYRSDNFSRNKRAVFFLLILLTLMLVDIHYMDIDTTSSYFGNTTNHSWQVRGHEKILLLAPDFIPHSYRFLPNSMIRLIEFLTGDFSYARSLYRHTFMFLLLYSIYYYARMYCSQPAALVSVLFYAAIYPVSIRFYAGQLTDPMSHLLFVWSFILMKQDNFAGFSLTVLVGILAKESIIIMPAYYLLSKIAAKEPASKQVLLVLASAALVFLVRLLIIPDLGYSRISGVSFSHISGNLAQYQIWPRQLAYTVGVFLPFFILSWKTSPRELRNLVLFILPPLVVSNMMFSWLHESRNLIPAVIPMAIITSEYLLALKKPHSDK
ncbi:MAG: hypothetical protein H3C68_06425 [Deltaproteobacteria bacterium]|nr:hypothetical protein [Deltaproteobacteria bacterium]MBZ0219609.1 hypothetical protein [Deltaproteobacteria bacterium]